MSMHTPPDMTDPFVRAGQTYQKLAAELNLAAYVTTNQVEAVVGGWATGGHVLLEATYGTGKTTIAKALGAAADVDFKRLQGTPDVTASDITGHTIYNQATGLFEFRKGPIFAGVLLVDEIQRMQEKPQAGLTEAMQEGQTTPAGSDETYQLPKPQLVIATRNADGAVADHIVDRFTVGIRLPKQTAAERKAVLAKKRTGHVVRAVVDGEDILELQTETTGVTINDEVEDYANGLIDEVHDHSDIEHEDTIEGGARSLINMLDLARFYALIHSRRVAEKADVAFGARNTLPHRIAVKYGPEERGMTSEKIVEAAIARYV